MPILKGQQRISMSAGSLKVKIFDAKGTEVIPVAKSTVTVGSGSHCDIVLEHASIQGEHVRAWLEGGRIWVQDLGTTGGTFLNGIRLPGLKPMLVRDLDVLKLGECPATLGLEANLVRAPVVKTQSAMPEVTLTDIKPLTAKDPDLEKRREELAKVSRELAELKLQLQMARMEKNSSEEMRKQINALREELRQLGEQRDKLTDTLKRLEDEKHAKISSTESEIVDMKLKAERDIKDMRDAQGRKLGHWKVDAVAELSRHLHLISAQKQKSWATRPLSQDMIFEWESELNVMIRRVLLEENQHSTNQEHTNTHPLAEHSNLSADEPPAVVKPRSSASTSTSSSTRTKTKSRSKRREEFNWSRAGLVGIGVALLGVIGWIAKPYVSRSAVRNVASQPGVAQAMNLQQAGRWQPKQNRVYKKTYTENILFTESFTEMELSRELRGRWMADLAKAARSEWKLDDRSIALLAGKEQQLVMDLQRLRDGIQPSREQEAIAQMKARETVFQQDLIALLKSPHLVEKFQRLKRNFFTRNQQALVKQTR